MNSIKSEILTELAKQLELAYPYYYRLIELEKLLYQDSDEFKTTLAKYKKIMARCNALFSEGDFIAEDVAQIVVEDNEKDSAYTNEYIMENIRKYFASLPTEQVDLAVRDNVDVPLANEIKKCINTYLDYLNTDVAINMLLAYAKKTEDGEISYSDYVDNKYHYLAFNRILEQFMLDCGLDIKDDCEMPSQSFLKQQPDERKKIISGFRSQYLLSKVVSLIIRLHDQSDTSANNFSSAVMDTVIEGHIRVLDDVALEKLKQYILNGPNSDTIEIFKRKIESVQKQRIAKLDKQ